MLTRFGAWWGGGLHEEDKALIKAFLDGDKVAVAKMETWIRSASWSFRRDLGEDGSDLCQDLLIEIIKLLRAGKFTGKARLKTYLWRVTANACLDHVRRGRRCQSVVLESVVRRLEQEGVWLPGPGERMVSNEILDAVLEKTSPECRYLWRQILQGFTYREISEKLGVIASTLRVRVLRCRRRAHAIRDRLLAER